MNVFGVSNTNPYDLAAFLKKEKPRTAIYLQGSALEQLSGCKIAVFSSVDFAYRVRKKIPSNASVFIVDLAVNLKRVKDIDMVDCRVRRSNFQTDFFSLNDEVIRECLTFNNTYPHERIRVQRFNLYEKLFKKTPISVLSNITTYLYKIPDKEKRERYKYHVYFWLVNPQLDDSYLKAQIKIRDSHMKQYLLSQDVANLREIFSNPVNYKKLLRKYNISQFDLNYLNKFKSKTLRSTSKGKPNNTSRRGKKHAT